MSVMLSPRGKLVMHHDKDPKEDILERIGDLSGFKVFLNNIVVALYERPKKTKGGIILTDKFVDKDIWQGTTGLVVAMGPLAYVDDEHVSFAGQRVNVGDWVFFRAADGSSFEINTVPCRIFTERGIAGVIPNPDYVF